MHGLVGTVGVIILLSAIVAGGISFVTSYWQVNDSDEHRGFWMTCLRTGSGARVQCISNIEGDTDKARYDDNAWFKATVCCHICGIIAAVIGAHLTVRLITGDKQSNTKAIIAVFMSISACVCFIASVTMWKFQFVQDNENLKDGWSFFLAIVAAGISGIGAAIVLVSTRLQ